MEYVLPLSNTARTVFQYSTVFLLTPTIVAGVTSLAASVCAILCVSVCLSVLFVRTIKKAKRLKQWNYSHKTCHRDSPSQVLAHQPSINIRSKGQRSRSQGHKVSLHSIECPVSSYNVALKLVSYTSRFIDKVAICSRQMLKARSLPAKTVSSIFFKLTVHESCWASDYTPLLSFVR